MSGKPNVRTLHASARADDDRPRLSVLHAVAVVVGVVVGVGIFKTPPLVAAQAGTPAEFIMLWLAGGLLMIAGALCYAELASARPSSGGEFDYLTQAYGRLTGFLFAWGRMAVMQTGAIAAVAFALGDFANVIVPLGGNGAALYAALSIIALTASQLLGTTFSGRSQLVWTLLTIGALMLVTLAAFGTASTASVTNGVTSEIGAIGLAFVFVLLTYGGWNEAAYLSGEVEDARRNMVRVLLSGTLVVIVIYLLINWALLSAFGLDGLKQAKTVLEGPVAAAFGPAGTIAVALIVLATAISTINATIFTGARSMYALGRAFPLFAGLARLDTANGAPRTALLVQAAITVSLIALGATAGDGFRAMVEYTAPVFWTFLFLVGLSLFIFRRRNGEGTTFRVPLYPVTPLIFCATCLYLVYSSLMYTGLGAIAGVLIIALGVPLYMIGGRLARNDRRLSPAE